MSSFLKSNMIDIEINNADLEKRFAEICQFDLTRVLHRTMMKTAIGVRDKFLSQAAPQAVTAFYDRVSIKEDTIEMGSTRLRCDCFTQIPEEAVIGAYVYVLTIGECSFPQDLDVMDQMYLDIWATSYVDLAVSDLIRRYIQDDLTLRFPGETTWMSPCFGPGYYGMALTETEKIWKAADGSLAGVALDKNGMLTPEKSCGGIILIYNRKDIKAQEACLHCTGSHQSCRFCAVYSTTDREEAYVFAKKNDL